MKNTKKQDQPVGRQDSASRIEDMDLQNVRADKKASDFDETARKAAEERTELKPGQKAAPSSKPHNNGRGGGK